MKKLGIVLSALILSIAFFSCAEKDYEKGVCLYHDLMVREEAGSAKKVYNLDFAEEVSIVTGEIVKVANSDGSESPYIEIISRKGKKGWANAYYIVRNSIPAVIVEEATIFNSDRIVSATNRKLSPITIIAVQNMEEGTIDSDFYSVVWSSGVKEWIGANNKGFLKKSGISFDPADIKAASLYHISTVAANDEAKKIVLEEAVKQKSKSFGEFVKAELAKYLPAEEAVIIEEAVEIEALDDAVEPVDESVEAPLADEAPAADESDDFSDIEVIEVN
ncbi:MAG: hypothetical protein JXR63_00340 [Spirochaetales bacterium]|nr:hypothetical protein [Spirochaetales bacterium]